VAGNLLLAHCPWAEEVDFVIDRKRKLLAVEVKSGGAPTRVKMEMSIVPKNAVACAMTASGRGSV